MSATQSQNESSSTSTDQIDLPDPYKSSVIWPPEFTASIEQNENIKSAFRKTYYRIQKAGCHFLLLEPTGNPQGSSLFLYYTFHS